MYTQSVLPTDSTVGPFPIGFNYLNASSIIVTQYDIDGVSNPITKDFTFTGTVSEEQPSGSTINLAVAITVGKVIQIKKEIDLLSPVITWGVGAELSKKNLRSNTYNMLEMAQVSSDKSDKAVADATYAVAVVDAVAVDAASAHADMLIASAKASAATASEVEALASALAASVSASSAAASALVTDVNIPAGNISSTTKQGAINELDADKAALAGSATQAFSVANATLANHATTKAQVYAVVSTIFNKTNSAAVAFAKTSGGTISVLAGTSAMVNDTLLSFAVDTAVIMPTLTDGTDYAIYACTDGTIRADASFSFPTGYTALTSRMVGGFHYAAGGNAPARAGGDTTPAINAYSIWDLKFKPSSPDPRGLSLVSGNFWQDIYPLGVDHIVNGTSKYNVTIADGSSPPKVPTQFGGNGTATYTTLTWWEAAEVMAAYGKRLPTYAEFAAGAFGTTEATSGGTDPVSTILRAAFTSKWGAMLATGNMWFWGAEFGGGAAGAAWAANTTGRGSTYQMENAAIFGGNWGDTSNSGSRASNWGNSPTTSTYSIGARGVCDHVVLE